MSQERDILILKFLWEYKVATSAMIMERYFPNVTSRTAYNCLQRLRKNKLITVRTTKYGTWPVWEITRTGLKEIIQLLPPLESKVTSSENPIHDLLVSSIHLGPFIKRFPNDITFITEQRLRSVEPSILPKEIPSPKEHRPDGYWIFNSDKSSKIFSLEVELVQKSKKRYETLSFFYGDFKRTDRCIWVVTRKSTAKTILRTLYKSRPEYYVHNFVLLKDILRFGWSARIFLGPEKEQSLLKLFSGCSQYINSTMPVNVFPKYILDNRLSYQIHSILSESEILKRIDSMGISV